MIYLIQGKPGVGKSAFCVHLTEKFLKQGRNVYSNIPTDRKILKSKKGNLFYWDDIEEFRRIRSGIVIMDEASSYFQSRFWHKMSEKDLVKFQQHRKDGLTIFSAVQDISRIDVSIRQLTAYVIEPVIILQKFILIKTFDLKEVEKAKRKALTLEVSILRNRIYKAYDTNHKINISEEEEYEFRKMESLFFDEQPKTVCTPTSPSLGVQTDSIALD